MAAASGIDPKVGKWASRSGRTVGGFGGFLAPV